MIGSVCAGLLGDRIARNTMLISCIVTFGAFSLISAFARSPLQLAALRFLTGLVRGGGLPTTVALAYDFRYRWRVAAGDDATARHLAAEALRATRRTISAQCGGAVSEGACSKHHVALRHKRAESARHLRHPAVDASYSAQQRRQPLAGNLRYQHVRLGNELQVRY